MDLDFKISKTKPITKEPSLVLSFLRGKSLALFISISLVISLLDTTFNKVTTALENIGQQDAI